jgi:NitT/TauT family transport system ATP-binding protein
MTAASTAQPAAAVRVRASGVRREFDGGVVAVDRIDLDVQPGEFVAILGPSGSGKSTLLRMIAGLDRPTDGTLDVGRGNDDAAPRSLNYASPPPQSRLAYVFQDAHLLPWRTVLRNVALPLELLGRDNRLTRAREAIEQVGLSDAIDRYPAQLSGGMRMRASLARALVNDPELLLLDEPFAALDEITRQQLDDQLRALWAARGMTVLFVTHSIVEAAFLADRAVVLSRRPGRVVLDYRLNLPRERAPELRTDPTFAREMRVLFDALQAGGGA